jgi:hypothetical protein
MFVPFGATKAQDTSTAIPQSIVSNTASLLPFRIGIVGGVGRSFPLEPLAAIAGVQPFPVVLNEYTPFFLPEIGLEAAYRLSPTWEIGLRGQYLRTSFEVAADERLPVAVWNPTLGVRVPTLARIRNVFGAEVQIVSATPLLRLFLGDVLFLSAGARFDLPLQTSFRFQNTLLEPPSSSFVVTPLRTIDSAFRAPSAIAPLSVSPIVSLGVALPLGRTRLMAELQAQPIFQPFRGVTPERTQLSQPTVRLNVALILGFLTPQALPSKEVFPEQQEKPLYPQTTLKDSLSARINTLAAASKLDSQVQAATTVIRRDTIFQRDTTVRIVAWSASDTVRLLQRTSQRISTTTSSEQLSITESFQHDVPKPKPFLVGTMNVRFIPVLAAPKTTESQQTSRFVEKPMIVRSLIAAWEASSDAQSAWKEVSDTVEAVRMPLVRFVPKISSEVGVKQQTIVITPNASNEAVFTELHFLTSQSGAATPFDWDAQMMLFPRILPNFQTATGAKPHQNSLSDTLFAWMSLMDNEAQIYRTDTVNITVERSERSDASANARLSAAAKQQSRWTLVQMPLHLKKDSLENNSSQGAYTLTPQSQALLSYLQKTMSKRGGTPSVKNCMVYALVPSVKKQGTNTVAEPYSEVLREVARVMKASVRFVVYSAEINMEHLEHGGCIRVLLEE